MRRWWLCLALLLAACTSDKHPAPVHGTTYRIGNDTWDRKASEMILDIMTTTGECRNIVSSPQELEVCKPFVDRARAEVHLSFQLRDRTTESNYPVAMTDAKRQLVISHDRTEVRDFEVIPHVPRASGQLYIVLIDGSGSMYQNDGERIKKVRRALLQKEVLDAFFPSVDAKTGVMLLTFTDRLVGIDGGEPRIIRGRKAYRAAIRDHLGTVPPGYTYLFKAVRKSMQEVVKLPEVKKFLAFRHAQPTVIALTDGFNNESGSDTCSTNVGRLKQTVDAVREARAKASSAKPVLFTVGLGEPYRRGEKPEGLNARINATTLCGRYADSLIDNPTGTGLEDLGIDHVSLAWLAEAGGGVSFVKRDAKGLAQVFLEAAAKRYEWFELKYRVSDSIYHRKSFETEIRMQQPYVASTIVELFPSPWLDAPTARVVDGEEWVVRSSLLRTLTILMPVLGLLVFLNYVPAALFNARRAVLRRARPRK